MDLLQNQITILSNKIDALYEKIEQLNDKISAALGDLSLRPTSEDTTAGDRPYGRPAIRPTVGLGEGIRHKDILIEDGFSEPDGTRSDHVLSPEVQTQRLTAQLTAAYNRIAALEEQLLARRIR
ncbi:MAG: hypothetical protein VKK04_21935 [Synechococcales bacterium]|nr:hypothetical protein [Synechococcales bacterium]